MRRVLFITYYFLPQTSVGMLRTTRIVRAADTDRIKFTVLSVKDPEPQFHGVGLGGYPDSFEGHDVRYVRELPLKYTWQLPAVVLHKLCTKFGIASNIRRWCQRFWYIDMEYCWMLPCIYKALELHRKSKFDAIMVSAPPFSSLVTAVLLKKILKIPLIADYRDAWSYDTYGERSERLKRREKRLMRNYDKMIVTSWSDHENYARNFEKGVVENISNGIEKSIKINPVVNKVFTLLYTGAWGTFDSSPKCLLEALKQCDFEWRLYSVPESDQLISEAESLGVKDNIRMFPRCSPEELHGYFAKADLLFITKGKPAFGSRIDTHISAKLYDYCASGRPILGELPEGDSLKFMQENASRWYHAQPGDLSEIVEQLQVAHKEWSREGVIHTDMNEFCAKYSSEKLSRDIVKIVERVLGS